MHPVLFRRLVVVIGGELSYAARNGDRQASAGVVISEEDVGNGLASALTRLPRLDNGGNVRSLLGCGKRSAVDQIWNNQVYRSSIASTGGPHGGGVQAVATSWPSPSWGHLQRPHCWIFAHHDNRDTGLACSLPLLRGIPIPRPPAPSQPRTYSTRVPGETLSLILSSRTVMTFTAAPPEGE